jgi:predicted ATPase
MERGFLHGVRVMGFRSASDLALTFRSRFMVLVGPNASGKTTTLDAIHVLSQQFGSQRGPKFFADWERLGPSVSAPDGAFEIMAAGRKTTAWMSGTIHDRTSGPTGPMVSVGPDANFAAPHLSWTASRRCNPDSPSADWAALAAALGELGSIRSCARLRLSASASAAASLPQDATPRLGEDGQGLPSLLAWLAANQPEDLKGIEETLRAVVPTFVKLRVPNEQITYWETEEVRIGDDVLPRRTKRQAWGHRLELEFRGLGFVPAALASEGTILALALLGAVRGAERPRLVLLDDVEKALHPTAQWELVRCLRRLLESEPQLQLLVTTHSPYVVDEFEAEDVIALGLDASGHTRARPLSDHPDHARLRGELRAGEFWSSLTQGWITEPL